MIPHHTFEGLILAVSAIATSAATMMVSERASAEQAAELQLFLLPLIGAMVMTAGAWLLNPQEEARRQTLGRCVVALFTGTMGPQAVVLFRPSLADLAVKPVFLFLVGGLLSMLAYVLAKPFFAQLYQRADKVAEKGADRIGALIGEEEKK